MKIVARAPVRIDPAGGGTGAPPYSIEYGGCVVNIFVARYSYAQLQWLEPGAGAHLYSQDMKQGTWAPTLEALKPDGTLDFVKGFPAPSQRSEGFPADDPVGRPRTHGARRSAVQRRSSGTRAAATSRVPG